MNCDILRELGYTPDAKDVEQDRQRVIRAEIEAYVINGALQITEYIRQSLRAREETKEI